jgi:hypothetical protein
VKITYSECYLGEVKFKSEYIIPQLLLQRYRDRDLLLDGIRYFSCTADSAFPTVAGKQNNFVLPAFESLHKGYDRSLLANFSSSKVYSYINPCPERDIVLTLAEIEAELRSSHFTPFLQ